MTENFKRIPVLSIYVYAWWCTWSLNSFVRFVGVSFFSEWKKANATRYRYLFIQIGIYLVCVYGGVHTPAFRFFLLALAFFWVTLALRSHLFFSIYILLLSESTSNTPNEYSYSLRSSSCELPTGMRHRNPNRKGARKIDKKWAREVKRRIQTGRQTSTPARTNRIQNNRTECEMCTT